MGNARWQIYNTTMGKDRGFYAKLLFSDSDAMVVPWVNAVKFSFDRDESSAMKNLIEQIKNEITPAKALTVMTPIYRILDKELPREFTNDHHKEVVKIFDKAWDIFKATYGDEMKEIGLSDTLEKKLKEKPKKPMRKKPVAKTVQKVKKAVKSKPKKSKTADQLQLL